jgi:hypothetical protein
VLFRCLSLSLSCSLYLFHNTKHTHLSHTLSVYYNSSADKTMTRPPKQHSICVSVCLCWCLCVRTHTRCKCVCERELVS